MDKLIIRVYGEEKLKEWIQSLYVPEDQAKIEADTSEVDWLESIWNLPNPPRDPKKEN